MFEMNTSMWLLLEFTGLYLICVVSPGADFALVVRNSVMYSRRTGMLTALGTSLGLIWHATYTIVGIAILIKQSDWGLTIVRVLGGLYLGYLGVSSIIRQPKAFESLSHIDDGIKHAEPGQDLTAFQAVRVGFLTDALNPFCVVWFVTVFANVLDDQASLAQSVFFGAEVFTIALLWFGGVAWFFSSKEIRKQLARTGAWFGRITGSILVYYGIKFMTAVGQAV